jgi:hypothetical protein
LGRTLVTAAINVSSDIGWSVLLENVTDKVMIEGVAGSLVACSEMLKLVSLTEIVFEEGRPSGNAEENAHSSSSAAGAAGAGAGAGCGAKLPKSNIDGSDCCGVDCLAGEARAAKGSDSGACCCFAAAAACCCWKSDG